MRMDDNLSLTKNMLEANIEIKDELAAKGFRKALRIKAIKDHAAFYGSYLIVIWIVIAVADGLLGAGHLIFPHLLVIVGLWGVATAHGYLDWTKRIAQTKGWRFYAKLDEQGVITKWALDEERRNWNFYKSYREYDDYLEIESQSGQFTFVPKTPELFEMIEFTKEKIPRKPS